MAESHGFLDFEIQLDKAADGDYIVRASALGARAQSRFTDSFTSDKRTIIRQTLTTATLRHSARVRSTSTAEVKAMKDFGATLFNQVLREQVREFYYQCLGKANEQGKGLRMRMIVDPSLGDLPWEFLCTPEKEFMGLDPKTPIVRFVEMPAPVSPLSAELPLRVMVVVASPADQQPLDVAAEKERIASALQPLEEQGLVKVTYLDGPETWPRLIDALRPNETHILHFIGHGMLDEQRQEGVLVMEAESGESYFVGSDLMRILMQGKTRLRLVVLNSCLGAQASEGEPLSSVAVGLVRAGVPAVIAMQFEVSDRAAQIIASTFYKSLALNFPVDAALTEARREIALLDRESLEWATPILFMQVPDGQLFSVTGNAPNLPPSPAEPKAARLVRLDTRETLPITQDLTSLGRNPDNAIIIPDPLASRYHALIRREGATYIINDLGGANGTAVNGERINGHVTLRDGDSIRVGGIEFRFYLPAGVPAAKADSTQPLDKTAIDLNAQAAERFQAGEEAAARGDWSAAIRGYEGALILVPNYRDAAPKLANYKRRFECGTLYAQAQRQCTDRNYAQALETLAQIRRLDPKYADTANVQVVSECGLNYEQALVALQSGDRVKGAELLRAVVGQRPNFMDAANRLQNLADGGDGLFGYGPAEPSGTETPVTAGPGQLPPQPQASAPAGAPRVYELRNANARQLAEEVRQYFFTNGYQTQIVPQGTGWVVQGQKGGLRRLVGMSQAATVVIDPIENGLKVNVGGGRWIEQGAALAVSMVVLWPLLITGGVGMAQQKMLMDALWRMVDNHVATRGGRRTA